MRALRHVVAWLLTIKTMDARLTFVRACWGYRHKMLLLLFLGPWRVNPCGAWPFAIVVGWSPSFLAYVLQHVLFLVISCVPSVGVILVVAIIITTIIIVPIVIIVATIVVVSAIVITATVVIVVHVVVLPIAVVIPIPFARTWPLTVPRSCQGQS